jgi:hypothetical protein
MPGKLQREIEMEIRSNDFLQESKDDFTGNAYATAQFAALDAKIGEIQAEQETKVSKAGGARYNYALADEAEDKLDEIIDEVADFAASMTDQFPEFDEKFRKPRGNSRRRKIIAARVFADDGDAYIQAFKERGMEDNFTTTLRTRADALEQLLSAAVSETAGRVGATGNLPVLSRDAKKIIKSVDPIVRKVYKNNPAKLAAWNFATHVQRDAEPKPKPPTP